MPQPLTQNQIILRHLKSGRTLTHLEAMLNYGVGRLAARVNELRSQGVSISTEKPKGSQYAVYRMGGN